MHFDKAYVINLACNPERLQHFYKYAERAGLDVEMFPAIFGLDVDIEAYCSRGYLVEDFKLKMAGSLGTLLSHVHLWEKIADDPNCDVGLIFEDDAVFKRDFKSKLDAIVPKLLPEDWDMFWLGWHRLDCVADNEIVGHPRSTPMHGANSGHFAYMIKSSSVERMKSLLLPYNNRNSKDVILRKKFDLFNAYFLLKRIAKTPLVGLESVRKDINNLKWIKKYDRRTMAKIHHGLLG